MAGSVAGLVIVVAAPWASALAVILLVVAMAFMARDRRSGQLRFTPTAAGETATAWRDHVNEAWRPVSLRCDYLGPWLIGLRVEGRRLWLWPDSSDGDALRRLRRELLPLP
ncbi:hypothetical protein FEI13_14020 [Halomonas urmiana]|uniref:DUF2244 domain-containing protein n=1 Tax=Halomonas urmiana TaxID=490901 RepID=A0A5R8MDV8_9GAMM|nr:hypothetical protein FEI13_14020 [Halomonas urmiana]